MIKTEMNVFIDTTTNTEMTEDEMCELGGYFIDLIKSSNEKKVLDFLKEYFNVEKKIKRTTIKTIVSYENVSEDDGDFEEE